jgi:DNA polymerase III alpha subunit
MHFVHLGIHTEFSITESIVRIPDLVKAAWLSIGKRLRLINRVVIFIVIAFKNLVSQII